VFPIMKFVKKDRYLNGSIIQEHQNIKEFKLVVNSIGLKLLYRKFIGMSMANKLINLSLYTHISHFTINSFSYQTPK
jgi:hypothetical protein